MHNNIDYENSKIILMKYIKNNNINPEIKTAIQTAIDAINLQNTKSAIITFDNMDEDFCDWNYNCPTCNCPQNDHNEFVGYCDCGQSLIYPNFYEWKENFLKTYHWSNKNHAWTNKGPHNKKGEC